MNKQLLAAAIMLSFAFSAAAALSREFKAKVISIADGDTVTVLKDNVTYKIRLRGIDCPEKGQPYGKQAKLLTSQLAFNKDVSIIEESSDRYGRLIAEVILPDHSSLSQDLVRAGYAWWYRQYAPKDRALAYAEADAKLDCLGIWKAHYVQPPWEYRREKRNANKNNGLHDLSKISAMFGGHPQ